MTPQAPQEAPKYDILSPVFFADPYPTLQRMQDEDPVYWHPLLHAWVLTRYDDVLRVIRDPAGFSARRSVLAGLVFTLPDFSSHETLPSGPCSSRRVSPVVLSSSVTSIFLSPHATSHLLVLSRRSALNCDQSLCRPLIQ